MENTAPLSNKTVLKDRTLWFDGDSTVSNNEVSRLLSLGMDPEGMFVDELTNDIKQYNQFVDPKDRISVKKKVNDLSFNWNIPEAALKLDVKSYVYDLLADELATIGDKAETLRVQRTIQELQTFEKLGLFDVLRTLIFIINTLNEKGVVWGVGRGSSVSSYVLYLIGVHDVDSVKYELDVSDFLRNE